LLSLQFYRGSGEFYRYSPTQSPTKKTFPLSGINVDVSSMKIIIKTCMNIACCERSAAQASKQKQKAHLRASFYGYEGCEIHFQPSIHSCIHSGISRIC